MRGRVARVTLSSMGQPALGGHPVEESVPGLLSATHSGFASWLEHCRLHGVDTPYPTTGSPSALRQLRGTAKALGLLTASGEPTTVLRGIGRRRNGGPALSSEDLARGLVQLLDQWCGDVVQAVRAGEVNRVQQILGEERDSRRTVSFVREALQANGEVVPKRATTGTSARSNPRRTAGSSETSRSFAEREVDMLLEALRRQLDSEGMSAERIQAMLHTAIDRANESKAPD